MHMPATKKPKKKPRKYMLVDGNAIVHRGFHAIPNLSTKSGEPTNAVYGFTMILLRALTDIKPDFAAVAFDLAGPTFRHEQYADYKATRVKAPDELYAQIPRCKEIVRALGRGGMAVVYAARDLRLNRPVALKMIRAEAPVTPEQARPTRPPTAVLVATAARFTAPAVRSHC